MEKVKKFILKYGNTLSTCAFALSLIVIRPTCHFIFHQEKVPEQLIAIKNAKYNELEK